MTLKHTVLDYTGLAASVIGSVIVASNTGNNVMGYSFFLVGSVCCATLLHDIQDAKLRRQVMLNLYYIGVNVFGLMSHFLGGLI